MMFSFKKIILSTVLCCMISQLQAIPATVSESPRSYPINPDFFSVNHGSLVDPNPLTTVPHTAKNVFDAIDPNGVRYPTGEWANYWDSVDTTSLDPANTRGDQMFFACDATQPWCLNNSIDGRARLDDAKTAGIYDKTSTYPEMISNGSGGFVCSVNPPEACKTKLPQDKLEDRVVYAIENNQTLTLVCNMTTPGAEYYYAHDNNSGTNPDDTLPPLRFAEYPSDQNDGLYSNTPDTDLWWSHMKDRAFRCVNMINRARATYTVNETLQSLPASRIKVELGNELYWVQPYLLEAFPPDDSSPEWNLQWAAFQNQYANDPAAVAKQIKITEIRNKFSNNYDSKVVGDYRLPPAANRTCVLTTATAAEPAGDCSEEDSVYDELYVLKNGPLLNIPTKNDYAYAAVYFADLIKRHAGLSQIKIAIAGGAYEDNLGDVNPPLRATWWEPIQFTKAKSLEKLYCGTKDENDNCVTPLITAVTQHPYFGSGWSPAYVWGNGTSSQLDDSDAMGIAARAIYKQTLTHSVNKYSCDTSSQSYSPRGEVRPIPINKQPGCLGLFPEVWYTEWGLDWQIETLMNERAIGGQQPSASSSSYVDYNHMWSKALASVYMIAKSMEQGRLTSSHLFQLDLMHSRVVSDSNSVLYRDFLADMAGFYSASVDIVDSMGQAFKLLADASRGATYRTALVFADAEPLAGSAAGIGVAAFEQTGALSSLVGWKFYAPGSSPTYIILNLSATTGGQQVDLASIGGVYSAETLLPLQSAGLCDGTASGSSYATCQQAKRIDTTSSGSIYTLLPLSITIVKATAAASMGSDADGDEISDVVDNCSSDANEDQTDTNGNGIGDACEDLDGDQILDFANGLRVDNLYYLDGGFGSNNSGKVDTYFQLGMDSKIFSLAQQPDGKLVAAGSAFMSHDGGSYDFSIARYNTNGSFDSGFDTDGLGTDAVADDGKRTDGPRASQVPWYLNDIAHAVAVQSNEKILVAGVSEEGSWNAYFGLMRYDANGTLDASFGSGGKVVQSVEDVSGANAMQIQPDDKILLAGYSSNGSVSSFALLRYLEDGTLDDSFNVTGVVTTPIATDAFAHANAMALQNNGDILLAGYVQEVGENKKIALVRYKGADGALDTSFGAGGLVITPVGSTNSAANAVALQHDGGILVAGYSDGVNSNLDALLLRYNIDGSPDTSFGVDGMFISDASGYIDVASAVAVQADGKIWLAGRGGAYKKTLDFFVQRLNADGSLDGTFNSGAPLTVISNPDDGSCSETNPSASLLIQSDGNLAIGALSRDLSSCVSSFSIARVEIPDADGDNFRDTVDAFPANPSASVDSDGDGKPDGCNGSCAGLVLDLDDDNDGLSDAEENIIDTDPVSADSDHDGLNDGYEVNITNTDPLVQTTSAGLCNNASCTADTDGDGFTDGREYTLGTNLLNDLDPPLSAVSDEWVVLISDPFFSTPLEDWLTAQGDLWNSEGQLVVTYSIPRPANVAANNGVYCSAGITGVWCNNEWAGMLQLPSGYQLDEENNYLLAENSTPITDAFKIQISASHGCVLSQTLGLKCWGITGDEVANEAYIPSGVKDFALLGDSMACAALNNGKIKCWGGYATDGYELPDFEHVIALAAGLAHICAIESDGTTSHVRCVASEGNAYNQLGTDSDTDGYVDVATNPLAITAGSNHTCILNGDYSAPASRSVICWGANDRYQSQVPGLTNPISVQAGGDRTCAVQIGQSDALKCWPIAVGDGTAPPDSDGDSLSDYSEVTGSVVTNPLEEDTDSDTVHDDSDKFPANNSASVDTDNDGQPDSCSGSCTGGLVLDAFPTNASASIDTDNDGQPDSCSGSCTGGLVLDTDDDNDTVLDVNDANPLIGIGSCTDADQDGAPDGATCGGMAVDSDGYTIYGDNAANSLVRSVAAPSLGYYTINGWDGDDAIGGWTSNDTLNGGNGTDTVSYVNAATQVTVNLATGTTSGAGGVDTLVNIENIIGSNSSTGDTLTGNDNANVINGGLGGDFMYGGKGNDTYYANVATDSVPTWATPSELMGEDTTANGGGVDTVIFSSTTASTFTLAANVENITLTGSTALNAVGNASANVMDSSGNTAANTLTGGVGDDTYIVSSGDAITETNTTINGIDTVVVAFTATLNNANLENLTLTGSANLNATGNASDNVITGNAGNNTLNGAAGADTMLGGAGNDIYTVDNANDVVTELASEGTDLVNSSVTYTILDADVENLTLSGASAINAAGNASANILVGNNGANTLSGGVGNDILIGGADADVLTGDADADQFVLDTPATSDTVTDFLKDTDKLVVDMSSIGCGNNDTSIDTPLVNSTAGGFSGSAGVNELVIFTTNTEDTTATTAAAVIGSATSAMAAGRKKIFVVDNGTNSRVYRFTSAANNATVTAAELTLIATLNNVNDSGTGDYLFRP